MEASDQHDKNNVSNIRKNALQYDGRERNDKIKYLGVSRLKHITNTESIQRMEMKRTIIDTKNKRNFISLDT